MQAQQRTQLMLTNSDKCFTQLIVTSVHYFCSGFGGLCT